MRCSGSGSRNGRLIVLLDLPLEQTKPNSKFPLFHIDRVSSNSFRVIGLLLTMVGLNRKSGWMVMVSIDLYCITTMVSFPLIVEVISNRIGSKFLAVGTGMVYFLSQTIFSVLLYISGFFLNAETERASLQGLMLSISVLVIIYILSTIANFKSKKAFIGLEGTNPDLDQSLLASTYDLDNEDESGDSRGDRSSSYIESLDIDLRAF